MIGYVAVVRGGLSIVQAGILTVSPAFYSYNAPVPKQISDREKEVMLYSSSSGTHGHAGFLHAWEIDQMVTKPKNLIGLLENIKIAYDGNLLLDEKIFTEENLMLWFGSKKIVWRIHDNTKLWAYLVDNFTGTPDFTFAVARTLRPDEKKESSLLLSFAEDRKELEFSTVESIFGKEWENYPYFPPPPGKVFLTPTHPKGNARIIYSSDDGPHIKSITLEFGASGNLETAFFKIEDK